MKFRAILEDGPIPLFPPFDAVSHPNRAQTASILCSADDDGSGEGGGGDDKGGADDGKRAGDGADAAGAGDGDDKGKAKDEGKAAAGLMAAGGSEEEGDKDSGKTIEHDGKTLNVPEKFWARDADKLDEGAVLKAALDQTRTVRNLQNELADAKKGIAKPDDKSGVPDDVKDYLADSEGDNPFIKDGHLQLGEDAKNLKPVPVDDPVVQLFAEQAKKNGLTKDQFMSIVSEVLIGVDAAVPVIDLEAEAEKFGPTAKAVAGTNKTWADNLFKSGAISKAEHAHLLNMGQDAVGLAVVNKLRIMGGGKAVPVSEGGIAGELPSKKEWYAKMPDHRTDPIEHEKWEKEGEAIFGTGHGGSSESGLGAPQDRGGHHASYADKGADGGRTGAAGRRRT